MDPGEASNVIFPQLALKQTLSAIFVRKVLKKKEENAKFRLFCDATSHLNFISELIFTFLLCLRFNPTPKKAFV